MLDQIGPSASKYSPLVKAIIVIAFALFALIFQAIHFGAAAVKEYGWSKKAAIDVSSEEISEARQLLPQLRTQLATVQPFIEKLPDAQTVIAALNSIDDKVKAAVTAIPPTDLQQVAAGIEANIRASLAGTPPPAAAGSGVASPAPPA